MEIRPAVPGTAITALKYGTARSIAVALGTMNFGWKPAAARRAATATAPRPMAPPSQ